MRKADKARRSAEGKGHFSFTAALFFTAAFGLFLSGTIGWFFFTVMLLLPLVSILLSVFAEKKLQVKLSVSDTRLYKHEKTDLKITVINDFFLPSPPVKILFEENEVLSCDEDKLICEISAMPRSREEITVPFTAKMWYPTEIKVKDANISDYIGVCTVGKVLFRKDNLEIDIIPDIKDVPAAGGIIKSISTASGSDDSEDSSDTRAPGFTGTPGFEHREYVPGDPIKRINWKMSCKRDTLMIRLDEELLSSRHTFILDRVNADNNPKNGEICGEYMLGTLLAAVRSGLNAEVWFYKNEWQCIELTDENDISALRFALAGYRFTDDIRTERIPLEKMGKHSKKKISALIFFSPCFDRSAAAVIKPGAADSKTDTAVIAAIASAEDGVNASGAWLISEDGSAEFIR